MQPKASTSRPATSPPTAARAVTDQQSRGHASASSRFLEVQRPVIRPNPYISGDEACANNSPSTPASSSTEVRRFTRSVAVGSPGSLAVGRGLHSQHRRGSGADPTTIPATTTTTTTKRLDQSPDTPTRSVQSSRYILCTSLRPNDTIAETLHSTCDRSRPLPPAPSRALRRRIPCDRLARSQVHVRLRIG